MKKIYITPALRESKMKGLSLLAGSLDVDTEKETGTQYSKQNSIFDSVFGAEEDNVEE